MRAFLLAASSLTWAAIAQAQSTPNLVGSNNVISLSLAQQMEASKQDLNVTATSGISSRTMAKLLGDAPGPASYLAPGQTETQLTSGLIDASPAIQASLNTGGGVTLPCGTYLENAPLLFGADGQYLRGVNPGCTKILLNFTSGDGISSISHSFNVVRDLSIAANVARTAGAAIDFVSTYKAKVEDVVLLDANGKHYNGVELQSANTTVLEDVELTGGGAGTGLYLTGGSQTVDTYVHRMNINAWNIGVGMDNASGVYLSRMDVLQSATSAILVQPAGTNNVNALYAEGVFADTSVGNGWVFGGTQPITEVKLTDCWGSGSGTAFGSQAGPTTNMNGLIVTDPALDGLSIQSSHFHHNGGNGIAIVGGTNIQIGGGTTTLMNAVAVPNAADGLYIAGTTNFVQINGLISGYGGYMSDVAKFTNEQRYGVDIAAALSSSVIQMNMIVTRNNMTGGVFYPSGSTSIQAGGQIAGN